MLLPAPQDPGQEDKADPCGVFVNHVIAAPGVGANAAIAATSPLDALNCHHVC